MPESRQHILARDSLGLHGVYAHLDYVVFPVWMDL